jgi:SAM-dependent methyltransferase
MIRTMSGDMKRDWNERAEHNAEWFIASATQPGEAAFDASGKNDVDLFFAGLEHLLTPDTTVLDIGCGIGRMDRHVAPRVGHLIGIDVSGVMVQKARARLADLENVSFVEGPGESLAPIEDQSIDLVFSHIVFQHVPRGIARQYFGEARRVLRAGGHFVFQMPEEVPGGNAEPPDDDTFEMRFYRESQLRAELGGLGFEFVDCLRHPVRSEQLAFNQMRLRFRRPA